MENIKKELPYFNIGKSYGGNQRWMIDPWMHLGGCAALTTCDLLIYLALHKGKKELYPKNPDSITRRDYVKFGMSIKPYLQPRESGIKDLDTYIASVKQYFEDVEADYINVIGLEGTEPYEKARQTIMASIDRKIPVAYLMLKHEDKSFDFFEWHWFIVNGYEKKEDDIYIKVATYGKAHWLNLSKLWDTGQDEKGGIVTFIVDEA